MLLGRIKAARRHRGLLGVLRNYISWPADSWFARTPWHRSRRGTSLFRARNLQYSVACMRRCL